MAITKLQPFNLDTTANYTFANVTATNANLGNAATANYFIGSGNNLSNIQAANVSGTISAATTAGTVTTNAQPNITSVGTLTSLSVTGNISGGNINAGNLLTANYSTAVITTAAQPNITSVGTLTSLAVTGNITSGNANLGNSVTANYHIGNLYGTANLATYATTANSVAGANVSGAVTFASTANSVAGANVSGAVTFASTANSVAGANVSGQVGNALVTGTVYTAAQGNITSVGTLTGLTVGNSTANTIFGNGTIIVTGTGSFGGNVNMNNKNITSLATPSSDTDAATKGYVDSVAQGLDPKASVVYATTATLFGSGYTYNNGTSGVGATLTSSSNGALSIDGSTPTQGDRVLVKNESGAYVNTTTQSAAFNGIYTVTQVGSVSLPFILTRATDFDVGTEMAGAFTFVEAGSTLADTGWVCTANNPITVGTTQLTWAQFSSAGTYSAGTGLTLTGSTFSVNASQTQITSVGTLSSLSVTGNITSGNANLGNLVTANFFSGAGNNLSNIQGSNVSGAVGLATFASTANAVAGANVSGAVAFATTANTVAGANVSGTVATATTAGTITTAAQPNITSTGTLTSLSVTGNISAGNVSATTFTGALSGAATSATTAGTVTTAAQPNITSVGTLTSLSVTGNINAGNVTATTFTGALTGLASSATVAASANSVAGANVSGTVSSATTAGTVTTAAQGNITSVGTLTSLTVSGTSNLGAVGNITITGGTNGYVLSTNGSGVLSWVAQSGGSIANISNGNSNVNIPAANGNVNITAVGNTTLVVTGTGANITGTLNVTGNATVANLITSGSGGNITSVNVISANTFTASGNTTANILISSVATGTAPLTVTSTTRVANLNVAYSNVTDYVGTGVASSGNFNITLQSGTTGNIQPLGNAAFIANASNGALYATTFVGALSGAATSATTADAVAGANVTGNVTSATTAYNGNVSTVSNNQEYRPLLATNTTGNLAFKASSGISWNPSTYTLTAGKIVLGGGIGAQGVTGVYAYGANTAWQVQSQNGTGTDAAGQEIGRFGSEYTSGATTYWDSYISYFQGSGVNSGWLKINAAGNSVANITGTGINVAGTLNTGTGNISGGNVNAGNLLTANYSTAVITTAAQPNITSVGTLTSLAVTGNTTVGNLIGPHANGNSNVNIPSANGNINLTAAGNTTLVVTETGANIAGTLQVSGQSNLGAVGNVVITGGTNGYVLSTNGSGVLSWAAAGGSPAGSTTQVQYNNAGAFGASANLVFSGTDLSLGAGNVKTKNGAHLLTTASDTNAGGLYLDSSGSKSLSIRADPDNDAANTYINFTTDGTERAKINQYGIGLGATTPSSGTGITFPATQSASSDANTLDDYEEGTWTPVVKIGATTQTVSSTSGSYTKIGNQVYFYFRCEGITKSGTGNLTVEGFPYTTASGNTGAFATILVRWDGINPAGTIIGFFNAGVTNINFQNVSTSSGYTGATNDTQISATYNLYGVSGSYTAAN